MDCITLKNLRFRAFHGVFEKEKELGNDFEVDVMLNCDLSKSAASDNLEHTVDYASVAQSIQEVMHSAPVDLLETLLYRIGALLQKRFAQAHRIEVRVRKIHPPMSPACDYTELSGVWPR